MVIVRWAILLLLALFLSRRYVLLVASLLPARRSGRNITRSIGILVPAHNESKSLPRMLSALREVEYPAELLHIVLISDGSTDDTAQQMRDWSAGRSNVSVVELAQSVGKGGALARAVGELPDTALVAVFDADCVPSRDVLALLSGAFEDERVGAVTGFPAPGNSHAGIVARYAALERWTHHLVVLAGKDRLDLNPSIIGVNFAVRRAALDAAGGFPVGRLTEDIDLSMAMVACGWKLRWLRDAVVREDVVETLDGFRRQRNRWGRGVLRSAPAAHSFEQYFVVAGYLDRVVLLAAVLLVPFGVLKWWVPAAYMVTPGLMALTALWRAGARPITPFLYSAVLMISADIAVSLRSAIGAILRSEVSWDERA